MFGEFIREIRLKKNISLQTVATVAEVDVSLLSKIERGQRSATIEMIPGIANALELDQNELKVKFLTQKFIKDLRHVEVPEKVLETVKKELKNGTR